MRHPLPVRSLLIAALATSLSAGAQAAGKDTLDSLKAKKKPASPRPAPSRPQPARPQPARPAAARTPPPRKPAAQKPAPTAPLTLEVSPLGQTPYRTITEALRKAKPGAKIRVRSGIYQESLVLDKAVEIEPAQFDPGGIIIEGTSGPAIASRAPAATVRGLNLRLRADAKAEYCVEITAGKLVLDDCDVTGGTAASIGVRGSGTNPYLSRCRVQKAPADGILVADKANPTFDECTVIGSTASGAHVLGGARPIFQGCLFQKNQANGLIASNSGPALFTRCDFIENGASGAHTEAGAVPSFKTCLFRANGTFGVLAADKAAPVLEDCTMQGNTTGLQAQGGASFTARGCKVREQRNNGVFLCEKSRSTLENCEIWGSGWHGVVILSDADPTLKNCTSRDNNGSALQVHGGAKGTLEDCDLANGRDWSCVLITGGSEPTLRRTKVRNSARGGIEVKDAKLIMERCEVFGHGWSGLSFTQSCTGTLRNCSFHDNQHWGLALYDNAQVTIEECETRGNARGGVGNHTGREPVIRASRIQ